MLEMMSFWQFYIFKASQFLNNAEVPHKSRTLKA